MTHHPDIPTPVGIPIGIAEADWAAVRIHGGSRVPMDPDRPIYSRNGVRLSFLGGASTQPVTFARHCNGQSTHAGANR